MVAEKEKEEKDRVKCTTYSRVVGFLSPLSNWKVGKKEEFKDRVTYDEVLDGDVDEMEVNSKV